MTPNRDLAAAAVIGALAVLVVVFSLRLDVPGSIFTAPGLLPLITAATLFAMAVALGWQAVRAGAALGALARAEALAKWPRRCANAIRNIGGAGEARRTGLLMALVTAYVLLVGAIHFEFGLPLGFFTARISSYEVISVIMVAWILRLYWKAGVGRCLLVALVTVEALATIFRYGFGIPMPAGY